MRRGLTYRNYSRIEEVSEHSAMRSACSHQILFNCTTDYELC